MLPSLFGIGISTLNSYRGSQLFECIGINAATVEKYFPNTPTRIQGIGLHEIEKETKRDIKIYMDLSGPKIRTAQIGVKSKKGKIKKSIPVKKGEHIFLTKRPTLGKISIFGKDDEQVENAEIGVLLEEIIDDVNIGDVVMFDDGLVKSIVISKTDEDVELVITECYKTKIGSHKGINLPNTKLDLPTLTERDIQVSKECSNPFFPNR